MSGNVYEWCWDWYISDFYDAGPAADPRGASAGSGRVIRGGSWRSDAFDCRVVNRSNNPPYSRIDFPGLRVARSH